MNKITNDKITSETFSASDILEGNDAKVAMTVDVDNALAELDSLDGGDAVEDGEAEYDRGVTISFPDEVAHEFGVANLTVPIRDILGWVGLKLPDEVELLNGIREDFYAGDHEDDHDYMMDPPMFLPPSADKRAVARAARAAGRPEREAKREAFEAEEIRRLAEAPN